MEPEYEKAYREYIRMLAEFRRSEERRRGVRTTSQEKREDWLSVMAYRQALERYERAFNEYKRKARQGLVGRRDAAAMAVHAQLMGFERDDAALWKDIVGHVEAFCREAWAAYEAAGANAKDERTIGLLVSALREAELVGIGWGESAIVLRIRDELHALMAAGIVVGSEAGRQ